VRVDAFTLVPWWVRLAVLGIFILLLWLMWSRLDKALADHYTASQNARVAQDTSEANAREVKRLTALNERQAAILRARSQRLAAAEDEKRKSDDEMERLKREKPEVAEWAKAPVPPDVAARHNRLR
jgi:LysB family phage lysis regulatory protein